MLEHPDVSVSKCNGHGELCSLFEVRSSTQAIVTETRTVEDLDIKTTWARTHTWNVPIANK